MKHLRRSLAQTGTASPALGSERPRKTAFPSFVAPISARRPLYSDGRYLESPNHMLNARQTDVGGRAREAPEAARGARQPANGRGAAAASKEGAASAVVCRGSHSRSRRAAKGLGPEARRIRPRGRTWCIARGRRIAANLPVHVTLRRAKGLPGFRSERVHRVLEAGDPRYAARGLPHHALLRAVRSRAHHRRGRRPDDADQRHAQLRRADREAREQGDPRAAARARVGRPLSPSRPDDTARRAQRVWSMCSRTT